LGEKFGTVFWLFLTSKSKDFDRKERKATAAKDAKKIRSEVSLDHRLQSAQPRTASTVAAGLWEFSTASDLFVRDCVSLPPVV
jgi:hypothetical protein